MKYLLDTDHISFLQRRSGSEYQVLSAKMGQHSLADFGLPVVSFHEQALGAHSFLAQARTPAELVRGYELLKIIIESFALGRIVVFDLAACQASDALKAQKIRIGTMDLRIAALALSLGLTLLTRNLRDFSLVPGLVVEDWTT